MGEMQGNRNREQELLQHNTQANSHSNHSNKSDNNSYRPPLPQVPKNHESYSKNGPNIHGNQPTNQYHYESDDDPPPPNGPAPIPPSKVSNNPAAQALANIVNNRAPNDNNAGFLKNRLNNLNKVHGVTS